MRDTTCLITIRGEFPSLNEFIDANRIKRGAWSKGNSMKQRDQKIIQKQLPKVRYETAVRLHYTYFCRTRRRDLDNISGYFHKVFQDALVTAGVLPNDNWRYIVGFSDSFELDRKDPRIEIRVEVVT